MTAQTIEELKMRLGRMMRERGLRRLCDLSAANRVGQKDSWRTFNEPWMDDARPYYTGYQSGMMFAWDQYFEAILQWHCGWTPECSRNAVMMTLERIDVDGFIPRTIPRMWWSMFQTQPFWAQLTVLLARWGDSLDWLYPEYYFHLKHYVYCWLHRLDRRGEGLSIWDHAGHTGMDNHYERAGYFHDAYCEGVDLNAYLIRELEALAILSSEGYRRRLVPDESGTFRAEAAHRRNAMNAWCWDGQRGCYLDYHAREKRTIPVLHGGMFAALWAGVADSNQAERLVREHLLNPEEFARPYPVPALAKSEPGYNSGWLPEETLSCCSWRAHTWVPLTYMTLHGLRRYGYHEQARSLAQRNREMFAAEPFREYYRSEDGAGCGRTDFLGWSNLALYLVDELETDCDPTALTLAPLAGCAS